MSEYWFKQKRLGIGASPANWKGWAAPAVYLAAITGMIAWFMRHGHVNSPAYFMTLAFVTALFCVVCWWKTEGGWRWRWGKKD